MYVCFCWNMGRMCPSTCPSSPELSTDLRLSPVPTSRSGHSSQRAPFARQANKPEIARQLTNTIPFAHPFITERLPVTQAGPIGHHRPLIKHSGNHHHGNCCTCYGWSSRKLSPLMHRLASLLSPRLTHLLCAVFLRCENSRAL